MYTPKNLGEAAIVILEKIKCQVSSNQVERIINEYNTAWFRLVLPGLGWQRTSYTAKLTADEKIAANAFATTLPLKSLLYLVEALEKGFALADASKSSQATYGARMRSSLLLIASEPWFPGNAQLNRRSPDECRPKMRHGRGNWTALSLMQEKTKPIKYRLVKAEISPALQTQLSAFKSFMADLDDTSRVFTQLEDSTASGYQTGTLLWLGWLCHQDDPSLNPNELTLEHLVPYISEEMLEDLSIKQQKVVWEKARRELEDRINRHFKFLRTEQKADSPRTRLLKLATLLILAKFLYASQVEEKSDYKDIPLIRTLLKRIDTEQKAVEVWEKDRHYVADQSRKWPEPPNGITVLEYICEALIEPLRLECRPRQSTGDFCKGHTIAKSLLLFLLMACMGLIPPGRQQEPRNDRIALSCPVECPEGVPLDGVYWPLPPDWAREKRERDGSLADNYLFKVYRYEDQSYPQGAWVRETCNYKTRKHHGKRVSIINNVMFEDGQCLYDYIERYLCGQWYVGSFQDGHRYDWWNADLRGTYGKWLSHGRAELSSAETPMFVRQGKDEDWVSSYLFLNLAKGQPFRDTQMSALFARNSYRILGKRITPHTFRYMWATWGIQVGLSDAELKSLARAMGCTVKTLRGMYERTSPAEKNRPINKAMRKLFPWHAEQTPERTPGNRLEHLKKDIAKLSPEELSELLMALGLDSAA